VAASSRDALPAALDRRFRIAQTLADLRRGDLFRERLALESPQGPTVRIDGREYLNFCSNDYLSLAAHPRVVEALRSGAARYGAGAGASALVCGRGAAHAELERLLADWLGRDRALIFGSGYLANLALTASFCGQRCGLIAEDRNNHASLIDAARLSRARLRRYRHADAAALETVLRSDAPKKLVLTDGVFSMEGDRAPVRDLAAASLAAEALLAVDDAHGIGVLGAHGGGLLEEAQLGQAEVPLLVGTFGKALGTAGAFIAGPEALVETLIQKARTYIYSTAPPPALAAATAEAVRLVRAEDERRARLRRNVETFRSRAAARNIPLLPSTTPIQPLLAGSAGAALRMSEALRAEGILVTAIRPPTVPRGTSRLRITLCAGHELPHIERLADALSAFSAPD
jgi:8-amino-7-oxononanoate synthase